MKAYSLDLCEQVVAAVRGGPPGEAKATEVFRVSPSIVRSTCAALPPTLAPRLSPGRPRIISPDLNPIEEAFSKVKEGLRRAKARPRAGLKAAMALVFRTVTGQDARSWIEHAGHQLQK